MRCRTAVKLIFIGGPYDGQTKEIKNIPDLVIELDTGSYVLDRYADAFVWIEPIVE